MPVDQWAIRLHNYTPFEREDVVYVNIPLAAGQIFHASNSQRELQVSGHRYDDLARSDWVQYWPMMLETADYPWLWRDDSLRLLRLAFPVKLPAGVHVSSRTAGIPYEYFSELVATVRLDTHATGNAFQSDASIVSGLAATNIDLDFEGDVGVLNPLGSPDHTGALRPAFEIQRPYGPDQTMAWVKTFITQSRTIPADWRTRPSLWCEMFYQLQCDSLAASKTVDSVLSFGPSRITEDNASDLNPVPNVDFIQSPIYWRVHGPGEAILPEERIRCPVWPGTNSSVRVGSGGHPELCVFDPDDWQHRTDIGSMGSAAARRRRERIIEGSSFPNRVPLRYLGSNPSSLERDTSNAIRRESGQVWAIFRDWHLSPWKEDFGPWGHVLAESQFNHTTSQKAYEEACKHTDFIYENFVVGSQVERDTSGRAGTGRARRDPLASPYLGFHPNSPRGGTIQDYGFTKCWVHTSPTEGNPDLRAWHASAMQYSGYPIERRERDGTRYNPEDYVDDANHPGLGTRIVWTRNGLPYYPIIPTWAKYLGKPPYYQIRQGVLGEDPSNPYGQSPSSSVGPYQFNLSSSGRWNLTDESHARWEGGLDTSHQSFNSIGHYLWLRGDPFLLWWMENPKNHAMVSGAGAWDVGAMRPYIEDAVSDRHIRGLTARAEARNAGLHTYLKPFGGDHRLDAMIYDRIVVSFYPHRFGNPDVAPHGPIPTDIPDPITLLSHSDPSQPPGPAWQAFMIQLKERYCRSLARMYAEDAERASFTTIDARDLVDKLNEIADECAVFLMTQGASHNRVPSTGSHHINFVATIREFIAGQTGHWLNAGLPQGFGKKLTNAQMVVDSSYSGDQTWQYGSSLKFVFQVLAALEHCMFEGLGTTEERTIAQTILQNVVADWASARMGEGEFAAFGWGTGESSPSSQYWTWFARELGGTGPYPLTPATVSRGVSMTGESNVSLTVATTKPVTMIGETAIKMRYRVIKIPPVVIAPRIELVGESDASVDSRVLVDIQQSIDLSAESALDIDWQVRGESGPLFFGSRLWGWWWAGEFGQHVTLNQGAGNPNAIDQVDDLSGNGRDLIGMNPDDFGNDRRAGYRQGVAIGSQVGGPWSTTLPLIGIEALPSGLWFPNAYRTTQGFSATGEFYVVALCTNTRHSGSAGRDMWGNDVNNNVRLGQDVGGGRLYMQIAGSGGAITAVDAVPHGVNIIEIWRDSSDEIHVRQNGNDIGNASVLSGNFDFKGFGYRNENSGSTSYWDDYLGELVAVKGSTTAAERDRLVTILGERWRVPGLSQPLQPIQRPVIIAGDSTVDATRRVLTPAQPPTPVVAFAGESALAISAQISGAGVFAYTDFEMEGDSAIKLDYVVAPISVESSIEMEGGSNLSIGYTIPIAGMGQATRQQEIAYKHIANTDRFGVDFNYEVGATTPSGDNTVTRARGLIDYESLEASTDGTNAVVEEVTLHIVRHPDSVLEVNEGRDFVHIPFRPGEESRRGRIVQVLEVDVDFFTVKVQR